MKGWLTASNTAIKSGQPEAILPDDMPKNLINFSQETCVTYLLTMRLHANLKSLLPASATASTILSAGSVTDNKCLEDVAGYKIYYKIDN